MPSGVSGITQESIDRVIAVIYVQDAVPETQEATAQWRHDNIFKKKYTGGMEGLTETPGSRYSGWPLCMLVNERAFKDQHHFKVHYFGLDNDTGILSPYITDKPYGYFASRQPILISVPPLPENENGALTDDEYDQRSVAEVRRIFSSGYWAAHCDDNIVYDKNVAGKIDMIIILFPPKLNDLYYKIGPSRQSATTINLSAETEGRYPYPSLYLAVGIKTSNPVIMHEYCHKAYSRQNFMGKAMRSPDSFPDLYVEGRNGYVDGKYGAGEAYPYTCHPADHGTMMAASTGYNAVVVDPLLAKWMELSDLERIATQSGEYLLENIVDNKDYLVVRSPLDRETYCAFYYITVNLKTLPSFVLGVYAFVYRMGYERTAINGERYRFDNFYGRPLGCYVSYEMSPEAYGDFDNVPGSTYKRRAILMDFQSSLGITAKFIGYDGDGDIKPMARIEIALSEVDDGMDSINIVHDSSYNDPNKRIIKLYNVDSYYVRNAVSYKARVALSPDMSDAYEYDIIKDVGNVRAGTTLPYKTNNNQYYMVYQLLGGTRYYQICAYNANNDVVYSNAVEVSCDQVPSHFIYPRYLGYAEIDVFFQVGRGYTFFGYEAVISDQHGAVLQTLFSDVMLREFTNGIITFTGLPPGLYDMRIRIRLFYGDVYGGIEEISGSTMTYLPGATYISEAISGTAESMHVIMDAVREAVSCEIMVTYMGVSNTFVYDYDENGYDVPAPYPGASVDIRVRGCNGSAYSNTPAYSVVEIQSILPPTSIMAIMADLDVISLTWHHSANIDSPTYVIQMSLDNFETIGIELETENTFIDHQIPFLWVGDNVYIRIKAAKHGAESEYTKVMQLFAGESGVPVIESIEAGYVSIDMRQVTTQGKTYIIEYWDISTAAITQVIKSYADYDQDGWITIDGFIPGKQYAIRVQEQGEEGWSAVHYFTTMTLVAAISACVMINDAPETRRIAVSWAYPENVTGIRCEVWEYTGMIIDQSGPVYENLVAYDAGAATEYNVPIGTRHDQTTIYILVNYYYGKVKYGPSAARNIYIPPMYDTPVIQDIIPEHEGALIKHYRYIGAVTYIEIEDEDGGTVVYAALEDDDYDDNGYIHIDGDLKSGRHYSVKIVSRLLEFGPHTIASGDFTTLYIGTPSIDRYYEIRDDYVRAALTYGGGVDGEHVRVMASYKSDMSDPWEIARIEPYDELELSGLRHGTKYYLDVRSYKEYDDGDVVAGRYSTQSEFFTFYPNNKRENAYMSKIVNAYAEKKSQECVLITWGIDPHNYHAPYTIYRSLTGEGGYEQVGRGMGNAFIDDISLVSKNETMSYKIDTLGDIAEVQLQVQADNWLLAVASDYLWQLATAANSSKAAAYIKSKNSEYCPECYNEELGKRTKSTCSTCDGSARLVSFVGPIYMRYSITQRIKDKESLVDIERGREVIMAWTGNTPILNEGDVIVTKDGIKYMVQSVPARGKMHSTKNSDEFVVRQDITLRRLNDNEYLSLVYEKSPGE